MRRSIIVVLLLAPAAVRATGKTTAPKAPVAAVSAAAAGVPLTAYPPSAAPPTLELIATRFAEVDERVTSLRARFKQSVRMEDSDAVREVEGEVLFRKPSLMRLSHRLPEAQTMVCDGTFLWVYRPSTNQVIRTRLETWRRKEPLAKGLLDLGKSADLLKRYSAALSAVSAPRADGYRTFVVTLTPKAAERSGPDSDFVLTLKASDKDFFPDEATLRVGRASIRSTFEDVRLNPEFPDETFRFSPPTGADVFSTPNTP